MNQIQLGGTIIAIILLLTACANDDMGDLTQFIKTTNARKNTNVSPLPEFKHVPSYFYEVENMRDPFIPFMEAQQQDLNFQGLEQAQQGDKKANCPHPDPHRVRVGLELMPLDSLKMTGTLEQDKVLWALILASDGTIYRVRSGDFMGLNSGKVISIEETKVELLELIPNREGCWDETVTSLTLDS